MSAEHEFINVILSGAVTLSSAGPAFSPREIDTQALAALNNKDKQVSATFTPNHQDKFISREYSVNPEQASQFEIKTWVINNPEISKRLSEYVNADGTKGIKIEDFISKISDSSNTLIQEDVNIATLLQNDPTVIDAGKKTAEYMKQVQSSYNGKVESQIAWATLSVKGEVKHVLAPIIYTKDDKGNRKEARYLITDNKTDKIVVVSYTDRIGSTASYSIFHPSEGDVLLPSYIDSRGIPTSAAVGVSGNENGGYTFTYFDLDFGSENANTIPTPGINNSGVERVVDVENPNETPLEKLIRNANENPISYPDITNGAYKFNSKDKFKVINDSALAKDGKVRIEITKENGEVQSFIADNEATMLEYGGKAQKRKAGFYKTSNNKPLTIQEYAYGWAIEQGQSTIEAVDAKGKKYELPVYYVIMLMPVNGKIETRSFIHLDSRVSIDGHKDIVTREGGSESNVKRIPINQIGEKLTWDNGEIPLTRFELPSGARYADVRKAIENGQNCDEECEAVSLAFSNISNFKSENINEVSFGGYISLISTEIKPRI